MILGIDPGLDGALVLLADDGEAIHMVHDMPTATSGQGKRAVSGALLADVIREALAASQGERLEAVVEQVGARPGQGVTSMFSFGQGFGTLLGVLAALGVRHRLVTPASWKRQAKLTGQDKDAARALALKLWPERSSDFQRKADVGRADAALIGFFGRLA
jgi:crossover junction endodeoxyribonuclease RuvC